MNKQHLRKYMGNGGNERLGKDYFEVTTVGTGFKASYHTREKAIAGAGENIADFFYEHGSLMDLNARGIGPKGKMTKTKEDLELVLTYRIGEAKIRVMEQN